MSQTELNKTFTNFPMSLTQLHLEIIDTSIGILTPQQHHCRVQERDGNQMIVTIAMIVVTVIFMIIIAALMLTMKCQQHHRSFEAPSGISYRVS
jgi:heme/copper-type cytochrome/quinol oxidase subunit 2